MDKQIDLYELLEVSPIASPAVIGECQASCRLLGLI